MNTIELIQNHRSVRRYQDKPISDELKWSLIRSAQMAASSSFFQAYSMIEVQDPMKRELLYRISGNQKWVLNAPLVLLFCADHYRSKHFMAEIDPEVLGYSEAMLVAVADAALAAQNLTLAAESQGLGVAYVGGIRNDTDAIIEAFQLPELVFPLFLLCLGYPDEQNDIKPRLMPEVVLHRDQYDSQKYPEQMEQYNQIMGQYYANRSPHKDYNDWSLNSGQLLRDKPRKHVGESLRKQGFLIKNDR